MALYAETSAVLAWLFGEAAEHQVSAVLAETETVATSDLTLVECDRAIWRAVATGRASRETAAEFRHRLARLIGPWTILRLSQEIVARAREPFPSDPLRALDALHVASALVVRASLPDLALLSLDERVRRVARSLGLSVIPS
jgi:predicted nucleic acid-binding protein